MPDRQVITAGLGAGDLSHLLRQCVQCGLCLPHCGTWLATGNEVQSPRGRLILLEEMLRRPGEDDAAVPDAFLQAFDQCIGCRACETACPSGVPFSLLQYGQERAAAGLNASSSARPESSVPGPVLRRMDRPGFLAGLAMAARLAKGSLDFLVGKNWRRRLHDKPAGAGRLVRLLGSLPDAPRSDADLLRMLDGLCGRQGRGGARQPMAAAALDLKGPAVAFFEGCANAGLLADTSRRTRELLAAAGCRLESFPHQDCCGALAAHTGRPGAPA